MGGKMGPGPRYAVIDLEYDAGGGEGKRLVAIIGNGAVMVLRSPGFRGGLFKKGTMLTISSTGPRLRSLHGTQTTPA